MSESPTKELLHQTYGTHETNRLPNNCQKTDYKNIIRFRSDITKATDNHLNNGSSFQQKTAGIFKSIIIDYNRCMTVTIIIKN